MHAGLAPLDAAHYPGRWHGGLNELQSFHFSLHDFTILHSSPLSRATRGVYVCSFGRMAWAFL